MRALFGLIRACAGGEPPPVTPIAVPDNSRPRGWCGHRPRCPRQQRELASRNIAIVGQPERGTLTILNNGSPTARLTWTDSASGAGSTSFAYAVDGSEPGTVDMNITGAAVGGIPVFRVQGTADAKTSPSTPLIPSYPTNVAVENDTFFAHIVIHAHSGRIARPRLAGA